MLHPVSFPVVPCSIVAVVGTMVMTANKQENLIAEQVCDRLACHLPDPPLLLPPSASTFRVVDALHCLPAHFVILFARWMI